MRGKSEKGGCELMFSYCKGGTLKKVVRSHRLGSAHVRPVLDHLMHTWTKRDQTVLKDPLFQLGIIAIRKTSPDMTLPA
jgi:hypothetical protein